jgi:putative transposase
VPPEEQIIAILKQGGAGLTAAEPCRQHGFAEQTYYRWKAKYGGMESGNAKRLKQLEDENRKLKHVVADLTLDNRALKDVLSKTFIACGTSGSRRLNAVLFFSPHSRLPKRSADLIAGLRW